MKCWKTGCCFRMESHSAMSTNWIDASGADWWDNTTMKRAEGNRETIKGNQTFGTSSALLLLIITPWQLCLLYPGRVRCEAKVTWGGFVVVSVSERVTWWLPLRSLHHHASSIWFPLLHAIASHLELPFYLKCSFTNQSHMWCSHEPHSNGLIGITINYISSTNVHSCSSCYSRSDLVIEGLLAGCHWRNAPLPLGKIFQNTWELLPSE